MSEYIKKDLLKLAVIEALEEPPFSEKKFERAGALINVIDKFPAADVEPVVRGELRINDQGFLECSACGKTLRMPLTSTYEMKRCYICGAHMMERSGSGE